jgi:hypothetical protein
MRPAEGPPPRTLRPGQQPQAPGIDAAFLAECADISPQELARARAILRSEHPRRPTKTERRIQTVTVEVTMEVRGDLRRYVDSALSSIPTRGGRKEWTYLDA